MITLISLADVETQWKRCLSTCDIHVPFLSYQWHQLWFETLAAQWQPYILSVDDTWIAPFAKLGSVVKFSGGTEIADYVDLIGPEKGKEEAWQQILGHLKNDGVKQLTLHNIPESSATLSYFQMRSTPQSIQIDQDDSTPLLALPDSWDMYLVSLPKKNRHELARKMRKFEREHSVITVEENPVNAIDTLLKLMRQNNEKHNFLSPDTETFFRGLPHAFPDSFVISVLSLSETHIAAAACFRAQDSLLLYNSGFDPAYPGAGFYLKAMTIKKAIGMGCKAYNFLQGREQYKYDLGAKDFFVYTIHVTF